MRIGGLNIGAFFAAQPGTPAKLAGFAFAFEHLEIAAYELLRRIAERANDGATVAAAERILAAGEQRQDVIHPPPDVRLAHPRVSCLSKICSMLSGSAVPP
jgi:hypothetical protein